MAQLPHAAARKGRRAAPAWHRGIGTIAVLMDEHARVLQMMQQKGISAARVAGKAPLHLATDCTAMMRHQRLKKPARDNEGKLDACNEAGAMRANAFSTTRSIGKMPDPAKDVERLAQDPAVSERQELATQAAAHGHSTLGIPNKVGREFVENEIKARRHLFARIARDLAREDWAMSLLAIT